MEAAHLDRVAPGARTSLELRAYDAPAPGLVPVCRFFHSAGAYFYSAFPAECNALESDPSWIDEGDVFHVTPVSAAGACPAGTAPVYRLFDPWRRDGPAHRYVLLRSQRDALWWRGWTLEGQGSEGAAFCVPVTPDVDHLLRTFANSGWQFLVYEPSDGGNRAELPGVDAGARFRPCRPFTGFRF